MPRVLMPIPQSSVQPPEYTDPGQSQVYRRGFRITHGTKRVRDEQQKVEQVQGELQETEQEQGAPEIGDDDDSFSRLENDVVRVQPAVLSSVAEEGHQDAIGVTNTLLEIIDHAEPWDPIHEFLQDQEMPDEEESLALLQPEEPSPPDPLVQEFDDDQDELALSETTPDDTSMFPPSRRPSVPDTSEEVPHRRATTELKPFVLAFGLWCQVSGITRHNYQSLLEVLDLLDDLSILKLLPRSVTTIKKQVTEQLPLLKLRRQEVNIVAEHLPTQGPKGLGKSSTESMYFFDPVHLFTSVLSSDLYRAKIHHGMAHFVDRPSELFHSFAWASSIRACAGEYARTAENNAVVFPSDCVTYGCGKQNCGCAVSNDSHIGRVFAIGKDYTSEARTPGAIQFVINPLLSISEFTFTQDAFPLAPGTQAKELFLADKSFHYVNQDRVRAIEKDILFDYRYEGPKTKLSKLSKYSSRFIVRNIWDDVTEATRPLQLSAPLRGELELKTYGRAYLLSFANGPCISLPLLTFIDAFGLYRNMYRSILGIYMTIAGLSWRERKRRANVLALALGPHASKFEDVIKILEPSLQMLDRGTLVEINGTRTRLCAFTMAYVGDMKQQQENSGMLSPIAIRGCSKCLVTKDQKADLTFNTVLNARYHFRVLNERDKAERLSDPQKTKEFLNGLGMAERQTPLITVSPALDIIRSRPLDAAHSEFAGIAKQVQGCLVDAILTKDGRIAYATELRHFPLPPGWGRLQSPIHHLQSYRMQESARLSIVTPLLLKTWLQIKWVKPHYLRAVQATMVPNLEMNAIDCIIHCFALMARSNTVMLSLSMSVEDRKQFPLLIAQSRKSFQRLFECAALSKTSSFTKGATPVSSRAASPDIDIEAVDEDHTAFEWSQLRQFGKSAFEAIEETFSVDGRQSKLAGQYNNYLSRPNVHAGLHMEEVAFEYATPNNTTTFSGEDKHRRFKADVLHTNHRDVTKVLLHKESLYQTIRFVLSKSFIESEPNLTVMLLKINKKCPALLDSLLPYSEKTEDEHNDSMLAVLSDKGHENAVGLACLQHTYVKSQKGWPLSPAHLAFDDPFIQMLETAYDVDYGQRHISFVHGRGLRWCQKLAFTDRVTEHRLVFKSGDFIGTRTQLARIDGVFIHELSVGTPRLFAYVTMVEGFSERKIDKVLETPFLKISKARKIIGLPSIDSKKHYIMHVSREQRGDGGIRLKRGGPVLLLHWEHNIQFM